MCIATSQLERDGILARSHWTGSIIRATRPFAVDILSFQTNETEIAATFALHMLARLNMGNEQSTLGTSPCVRAAFHVSYLLCTALFQRLDITISSLLIHTTNKSKFISH